MGDEWVASGGEWVVSGGEWVVQSISCQPRVLSLNLSPR